MASNGNVSLYARFVEAWKRIEGSIEARYFFEAIAIEESIMSNRLTSFLFGIGLMTKDEAEGNPHKPFATLISRLRSAASDPRWEDPAALAVKLDSWRKQRNTALHALTKSFPGHSPRVPLSKFLEDVEETAREGKELARFVSNWQRRQRARANAANAANGPA